MSQQENTTGYTRSSLLPQELCSCQNCILNDPTSTVCPPAYRHQQSPSHPCPRWDGGVAVRF